MIKNLLLLMKIQYVCSEVLSWWIVWIYCSVIVDVFCLSMLGFGMLFVFVGLSLFWNMIYSMCMDDVYIWVDVVFDVIEQTEMCHTSWQWRFKGWDCSKFEPKLLIRNWHPDSVQWFDEAWLMLDVLHEVEWWCWKPFMVGLQDAWISSKKFEPRKFFSVSKVAKP